MSRFNANLPNGRTIAWGYDQMLAEYFIMEYRSPAEMEKIEDVDDDITFSVSNHTPTVPHPDFPKRLNWSNGEILELYNKYPEIPAEHKLQLTLDLPF